MIQRMRVRMVTAGHGDFHLGVNDLVDETIYKANQQVVVLDAAVFAALVDVAKAAADNAEFQYVGHDMVAALNALDAAHPGWREWRG